MATASPGATRKLTSLSTASSLRPGIGEIDRLERQLAADGPGQRRRAGGRGDARLGGEEVANARGGAGGLRHLVPDFRQLPERARAEDRVEHELEERSARHPPGHHVLRAEPEHHDDAAKGEKQRRGGDEAARLAIWRAAS